MSLDCEDLHDCAELLHEAAAKVMAQAEAQGCHDRDYVHRLQEVVALEEAAERVEMKIHEAC